MTYDFTLTAPQATFVNIPLSPKWKNEDLTLKINDAVVTSWTLEGKYLKLNIAAEKVADYVAKTYVITYDSNGIKTAQSGSVIDGRPGGPGILLDTEGFANSVTEAKARSNHTGTQPATTITGLAQVAKTGAYSDLTGSPAIPTMPSQVGAQPAGSYAPATGIAKSALASTVQTSLDKADNAAPASALTGKLDATTSAVQANLPNYLLQPTLNNTYVPSADATELVQDIVAAFIVPGGALTKSYDDTSNTLTLNAPASTGGTTSVGAGGSKTFRVSDQVDFDGTTNIRAGFQAALDDAVAYSSTGGSAVLVMPAGIGPITTNTSKTMPYLGGSTTIRYSAASGFGLPVNLSGHLTIRGQGVDSTIIKLSAACRSLFWIDKKNDYDTFQNIAFEDFSVDNNGATGQNHVICGTVPSSNTPMRRLSLYNLSHKRLKVYGVPRDEEWDATANGGSGQYTMPTTKKAAFVYHNRQNSDYEAGVTAGSLPLTPYPGLAGAHAAKWNYVVDLTFEDVDVQEAQRAILVVSDITQNSSIWYDNIILRRCRHTQANPWSAWAPQTSFYIGGNCQGQRAEVIDCISVNVGDDGIEFGGMQELFVKNFQVTNPFLDGILVRYSQPPLNAAGVRIIVDGFLQTITASALNNDTITRSDGSTARRAFRGRPFEIKTENDAASLTLGQVILRDVKTIVEGGYWQTFNRSGLLGWNSSGPVEQTIIENPVISLRNLVLDYTSGEYLTELFTVRAGTSETGASVSTKITNALVSVENLTSNGAKFELHGFTPSGDGEIAVDGFTFEVRNSPSAVVARSALAMIGYKANAYSSGSARTLNRLVLRGLRGIAIGSNATVRRGVVVKADEVVNYALVDLNDFRGWALTIDIDKSAGGTNGVNVIDGINNFYQLVPDQARRNPQAAAYTLKTYDKMIAVTSTSAARTITLPAIAQAPLGRTYAVVDESNGAATNNITVAAASGETFLGGASSQVINTNGGRIEFYSNGTVWVITR